MAREHWQHVFLVVCIWILEWCIIFDDTSVENCCVFLPSIQFAIAAFMTNYLQLFVVTFLLLPLQFATASETEAVKLLSKADAAAARSDSKAAVEFATKAIEQESSLAAAFYLRGRERFRLSQFDASIADFDQYVRLRPDVASRQWERGITCYYAKKYEAGAKQFELYQTYHANDVENSVWRYLCMVPTVGVEKARAAILPIQNDRRTPMMQIYKLYRGELRPDQVLAASQQGSPDEPTLAGRLFYAHLYLGLYHEVAGQHDLASKYITLAADKSLATNPNINRYMWDVARIHAEQMQDGPKSKGQKDQ